MSKNISNLSGRIGLKNNLFQKISERSLKSSNDNGILKKLLMNIKWEFLQYMVQKVFMNF